MVMVSDAKWYSVNFVLKIGQGTHLSGVLCNTQTSWVWTKLFANAFYYGNDKGQEQLFDAIVNGEYKFADAENGAKSTLTAIMGRMATYSGQIINWEEALNSDINLMPDKFAWDADPPVLPGKDGYYPIAIPGMTKVVW